MNIETKGCIGCPFYTSYMDSWDDAIDQCTLIYHQKGENYFIDYYKNGNVKSKNKKTLDNCPLLIESVNVNLEVCR